ncbi:ABC transporter ATP-binding protein [Facklamia sp. DSM 111018]|uniref:ABC transporter ATP-binding protein n=1 Tax=Facklamia lactis TaxID=2749967 RepID=A0ABS0LNQ3_9LACT|nr:ABC transporter ATP-binding protein [Facklamia lactis]MBG9979540.1 ABC transporter ATP-binding protein [Facklamia lactis]MBG9985791.1 ABC transporter ATP-binding protein [Facklamia lactis]
MNILQVNHLKKIYSTQLGGNVVEALSDVSFTVGAGDYVAIMGESGSGKTTLLNILAALDHSTSGDVILDDQSLEEIPEKDLSHFRRNNLGFVFQDFNLLDNLTLKDNIFLPLVLSGIKVAEMKERVEPLATKLGISSLLDKYPYEVSGGQKQRTAVARALINDPKLVLADEPTGALDSNSAEGLLKIFNEINQEGQTILMVTHSVHAASKARRVLFIKDGLVFHEMYKKELTDEEMFQKISNTLTVMASGEKNYV